MSEMLDYLGKIYSALTDKWLTLKLLPFAFVIDQVIHYYITFRLNSSTTSKDYKHKIRRFGKITAIKLTALILILWSFFYGPTKGGQFRAIVLVYYIYVLVFISFFLINFTKRCANFVKRSGETKTKT